MTSAEIFTLCQFAKNEGGMLTIIGTFDAWVSDGYPATMASACLAVRLRFDESGDKRLTFTVSDADLNQIIEPIELTIKITLPGDASTETFAYAGQIPPLDLSCSGLYSLEIHADDQSVAAIPLYARVRGGPAL